MFSTHPNTENRIAELEALERELAAAGAPLNVPLSIPGVARGRRIDGNSGAVNPWGTPGDTGGRQTGPWG
jgi:hypothetical protein